MQHSVISRLVSRFNREVSNRLRTYHEFKRLKEVFSAANIDCVVDCGFHHGSFTDQILRLRSYSGPIFGFEANKIVCDFAYEKFLENNRVTLQNCAVSDHAGRSDFFVTNGEQLSSLLKPKSIYHENLNKRSKVIDVSQIETIRLDTFDILASFGSIFLKIDVQGSELNVLRGCTGIISKFTCIQVEVPLIEMYQDSTNFAEVHKFLEQNGFGISRIFDNNEGHFPFQVDIDCIYLNKKHFLHE